MELLYWRFTSLVCGWDGTCGLAGARKSPVPDLEAFALLRNQLRIDPLLAKKNDQSTRRQGCAEVITSFYVLGEEQDGVVFECSCVTEHIVLVDISVDLTVEQAAAEWLNTCENKRGLERSTVEQYNAHVRYHIAPFIGSLKLTDLTLARVAEFESTKQDILGKEKHFAEREASVDARESAAKALEERLLKAKDEFETYANATKRELEPYFSDYLRVHPVASASEV